jgi:hypothetical protein
MTPQQMKQAALKAIGESRATLKAKLDEISTPELSTGKEDDAIKHGRSALATAIGVLVAEEEWVKTLMLNHSQTPNDGTAGPLAPAESTETQEA